MFTLADYRKRKYSKEEPVKHQVHFNSTTQPLDSGESFIGLIEETKDCETIHVSLIADTSGNITLKQSVDGIVFDFETTIPFTANTPLNFHHKVKGRHFFIVIENNSGDNQTYLRAYTHIKEAARSFYIENSSIIVENDNLNNLTFDGDGNLMVKVNNPTSLDVNVTNASLSVTNSALSSLSFSGGRLLTSNPSLSSSSDSVLCYGSDDAGTTKRIFKTSSDGTVSVSGSVNVSGTVPVSNTVLSAMTVSAGKLSVSQNNLAGSTDGVKIHGSYDGVSTNVVRTDDSGHLIVVGSVTAAAPAMFCAKFLNITNAATVLSYGLVYLYGFYAYNSGSQSAFLRFYDTTTSVGLANQNSKMMFHIPPFTGISINYQNHIVFSNSFRLRASSRIGPTSGSSYLTDYDDTPLEKSLQVHINYYG